MSSKLTSLGAVPSTMLVTVSARALAPQIAPDLGFQDQRAESIVAELGLNPLHYASRRTTVRTVAARSVWFDRITRDFFARHPKGRGINLGCGLNTNADRVTGSLGAGSHWVDADLPHALALRRQFFSQSATRTMVEADVRDPDLFDRCGWGSGEPVLILIEGLLYYLNRGEPEALFAAISRAGDKRKAPVEIVFDYAGRLTVALSAWVLSDIARHGAVFRWPLLRPEHLRLVDPKLEVRATHDFTKEMGAALHFAGALHRRVTRGRVIMGCAHLVRA